jgi:hypothetical protein
MSNVHHTDIKGGAKSPTMVGPGTKPSPKEKPAFASADLPGGTQSKDRSGGTKRVQTHPKTIGL